MNHRRYWYIASPYTHEDPAIMQERYNNVVTFCAAAARGGLLVFSPIAHWHPIAVSHELPREHIFWKGLNHAMIIASQGIIVVKMQGWENSEGVQEEIQFAEDLGREIRYFDINEKVG